MQDMEHIILVKNRNIGEWRIIVQTLKSKIIVRGYLAYVYESYTRQRLLLVQC